MSLACLTGCLCADPLGSITNDKCADAFFGAQLVKLFIMKQNGTDFDGTTGNTISVEADWQTKLTALDDEKIVALDITGTKPLGDPTTLTGNDVPYGTTIVVDRPQSITGFLTFPTNTTMDEVNKANCWGNVKFAFLDNNGWLWVYKKPLGEFVPNATMIFTGLEQGGIGTKARVGFNLTWNNLCFPTNIGQYPFLPNLQN